MTRWPRKFTVTVAILAVALAACFVPPVAHSAMHADAPAHSDGHSHDHQGSGPSDCHEQNDPVQHDGDTGDAKQCCAAACGASAFIWNAPGFAEERMAGNLPGTRIDVLDALDWSLIDPPPRTV